MTLSDNPAGSGVSSPLRVITFPGAPNLPLFAAIGPAVVDKVMEGLLSPASGLTPGGAVLCEGMATVLALRARYGAPGKELTDIDKHLDLSFYEDVIREREGKR